MGTDGETDGDTEGETDGETDEETVPRQPNTKTKTRPKTMTMMPESGVLPPDAMGVAGISVRSFAVTLLGLGVATSIVVWVLRVISAEMVGLEHSFV